MKEMKYGFIGFNPILFYTYYFLKLRVLSLNKFKFARESKMNVIGT